MKVRANLKKVPLASLALINYLDLNAEIEWCDETALLLGNDKKYSTELYVFRYFCNAYTEKHLFGVNELQKCEVNSWITFSLGPLSCEDKYIECLSYLNTNLYTATYLVGNSLTAADIAVWSKLLANRNWSVLVDDGKVPINVHRWFSLIGDSQVFKDVLKSLPAEATFFEAKSKDIFATRKEEGKFVELPKAEMGKVIVRFPPEASGYLHIGHAKAALLNEYYRDAFKGKLIMRFDDTNPAKEKVDFEKVILEDLKLLKIDYEIFSHTSDHFDLLIEKCEHLLRISYAYVDDTDPETMKLEREQKIESKNRNNSISKNFEMWEEMKAGSEKGQRYCVRARIDMQSLNGCMRDPTIYRCKNESHPKTGLKYKVYPTYDFACPIVDSIEGVTHALRTTEYHDRDEQYYWFNNILKLRSPYIWEYSRLNMTNTVLSKRKLTWFVENGYVDGWDDPRMPTVRGVLRRGMTVEGLKQFITAQGSSRSVVFMEWDKIWAINKKVIDPIAPRYTAVDAIHRVPVIIEGVKEQAIKAPKHPKNLYVGEKTVWLAPKIWIDEADAVFVKEGENVTLINWGNILIKTVKKNKNKVEQILALPNFLDKNYKKTLKLTWLPDSPQSKCIECICVYYDFLISKPILSKDEDFKNYINHCTKTEVRMMGDPELINIKQSEIIQLQRKGFFICDVPYSSPSIHTGREMPIVLFFIPDGHTKEMLTAIPTTLKEKEEKSHIKPQNVESDAVFLNQLIMEQGNKVRNVKQLPADKEIIAEVVTKFLKLLNSFKILTGDDWSPNLDLLKYKDKSFAKVSQDFLNNSKNALWLHKSIVEQGNIVRNFKMQKALKSAIDEEVDNLLQLKQMFKSLTGQEWKPDFDLTKFTSNISSKESSIESMFLQEGALYSHIIELGERIRILKREKGDKAIIDENVKELLRLKAEYKAAVGKDWAPKPQGALPDSLLDIVLVQIKEQGDKIRKLKSEKVEKKIVEVEVQVLLELKNKYKAFSGKEWTPDAVLSIGNKSYVSAKPLSSLAESIASISITYILMQIKVQGDKIRKLKSENVDKNVVEPEVKTLIELKKEYKAISGKEWTLDAIKSIETTSNPKERFLSCANTLSSQSGVIINNSVFVKTYDILLKIKDHGAKIRKLKSEKAEKNIIETEVKILLELKNQYKEICGKEWTPEAIKYVELETNDNENSILTADAIQLESQIVFQGDKVRNLKSSGAAKELINEAVQKLLNLKGQYRTVTGKDYISENQVQNKNKKNKNGKPEHKNTHQNPKQKEKTLTEKESAVKKVTRLGLEALKEENLSDWYSQVITKGELIEYYDVSGCYILRPWSFSIWEILKDFFDKEIKLLGVKNCYFPIFVSRSVLEKEKSHIADFAPEVAWVTKSGDSDLAEHIAIRPTSETVMYPAYAKWIQSYRDLPIKLNQWNNVVRWEFKHPQPFLRTREFLWQEGHSAFAVKEEAEEEVMQILDLYGRIYTELLAIPIVKGRKTEKEKFAGGDYTLTVEAYISASGRAIQGATSHHLGQNFSKMFDIIYEDPDTQEKKFVYQNSWGFTTRTIGVMIMVHADNQGLVLPPRVASVQVIIVPCGITAALPENEKEKLLKTCRNIEVELQAAGIRAAGDYRDNYSPGWKFNHWELKGVPVRLEVGPKDIEANKVVIVRRDTSTRESIPMPNLVNDINSLLDNIQKSLLNKSTDELNANKKVCQNWDEFCLLLDDKCLLLSPFCGEVKCEEEIKDGSMRADKDADSNAPSMGAKSLCIPFDQPTPAISSSDTCINPQCKNRPRFYTLFGRSY